MSLVCVKSSLNWVKSFLDKHLFSAPPTERVEREVPTLSIEDYPLQQSRSSCVCDKKNESNLVKGLKPPNIFASCQEPWSADVSDFRAEEWDFDKNVLRCKKPLNHLTLVEIIKSNRHEAVRIFSRPRKSGTASKARNKGCNLLLALNFHYTLIWTLSLRPGPVFHLICIKGIIWVL